MLLFIPLSLAVLLVFGDRYFVGILLKKLKGRNFDRTDPHFEPTVTAVIPCYNEGPRVALAIRGILRQAYPQNKLDVIVVDDCSTDDSYQHALAVAGANPGRVRVIRNIVNKGKRLGIAEAVRLSRATMILSLDSDTIADPYAVRNLVGRFYEPGIAAVGGEVRIENANHNWLTRMQAIRYHLAYHYMKNLERTFHSVMCLSGCLTMYRRDVLIEIEPILLNRSAFGVQIKYGEDRYLTRQIIKAGYKTFSTCEATCQTISPERVNTYFSQQLRWKRSIIADFGGSLTHIWRVPPLVALQYLCVAMLVLLYPILIAESLRAGLFFGFELFHIAVLSCLGMVYWFDTRHLPRHLRVHPIYILSMTVVMPALYLVLTPLALMTLDSSNWETRVPQT
jgi:cellulose synthase/poly-beta-1,6-N-acetylglucosamine synthase-like glycosyltransferase